MSGTYFPVAGEESLVDNWDNTALDSDVGISQVKPQDVGYWQGKIIEFQNTLDMMDRSASQLEDLLVMDISEASVLEIQNLLSQYYERKTTFKFAAEAYNMISSTANSLGANMPGIKLPSGLGFPAFVIPAVYAAAIAGGAAIISFAIGWNVSSERAAYNAIMSITDEKMRNDALARKSKVDADNSSSGGTIGVVANIAKYAAIAAVLYFGYKVYKENRD
jgi:hypothetical protein